MSPRGRWTFEQSCELSPVRPPPTFVSGTILSEL